jgi:protein-tyrosine phosphatase
MLFRLILDKGHGLNQGISVSKKRKKARIEVELYLFLDENMTPEEFKLGAMTLEGQLEVRDYEIYDSIYFLNGREVNSETVLSFPIFDHREEETTIGKEIDKIEQKAANGELDYFD